MRLAGKQGLAVGVANARSIATGCARAFASEGARLAITRQDDRALPHVRPVAEGVGAEGVGAELPLPRDVPRPDQMDPVFDRIAAFDGLLAEASARAPEGRVVGIDEVGQVATFLASDAASGLTGTLTHIDAGRHVRMCPRPVRIENRTLDEIAIGDSAEISRELTQRDIELFAVMSGDVNPAHLDPAYAEGTRFHHVIAHGMWGGATPPGATLEQRMPPERPPARSAHAAIMGSGCFFRRTALLHAEQVPRTHRPDHPHQDQLQ